MVLLWLQFEFRDIYLILLPLFGYLSNRVSFFPVFHFLLGYYISYDYTNMDFVVILPLCLAFFGYR